MGEHCWFSRWALGVDVEWVVSLVAEYFVCQPVICPLAPAAHYHLLPTLFRCPSIAFAPFQQAFKARPAERVFYGGQVQAHPRGSRHAAIMWGALNMMGGACPLLGGGLAGWNWGMGIRRRSCRWLPLPAGWRAGLPAGWWAGLPVCWWVGLPLCWPVGLLARSGRGGRLAALSAS